MYIIMTLKTIRWGRRFNLADAKIYKLVNKVDDAVYVGSTCITLEERLQWHIQVSLERPSVKVYQHLNAIGWEHVTIALIEECPCTRYDVLLQREDYWMRELNSTASLNTNRARLTDMERRDYKKTYREKHREKLLEYGKRWRACKRAENRYTAMMMDMPLGERKRLLDSGEMQRTRVMKAGDFEAAMKKFFP